MIIAQGLDELFKSQWPTALSIIGGSLLFTWRASSQIQKLVDRLVVVEGIAQRAIQTVEDIARRSKPYDDSELKADINDVRASVSGMKAEFAGLRTELRRVAGERSDDMQDLRHQLKTSGHMSDVPHYSGARILIIDDNDEDVDRLRRMLSTVFIIESCATLLEAHNKLISADFDYVLLDLTLPDSRRDRTVREFVTQHPDMVVIAITGNVDEETRKRCLQQGADQVWQKGAVNHRLLVVMVKK